MITPTNITNKYLETRQFEQSASNLPQKKSINIYKVACYGSERTNPNLSLRRHTLKSEYWLFFIKNPKHELKSSWKIISGRILVALYQKSETISNAQNSKFKTKNRRSGDVLKIWTLVFLICFVFRNLIFEFYFCSRLYGPRNAKYWIDLIRIFE